MLYTKGLPNEEQLHSRHHNAHLAVFKFQASAGQAQGAGKGWRQPQQHPMAAACGVWLGLCAWDVAIVPPRPAQIGREPRLASHVKEYIQQSCLNCMAGVGVRESAAPR
jgi:hypothetical protein